MTQTNETVNTKGAAETGIGPTFVVAVEQSFPDDQRIIDDSLALPILPLAYRWMAKVMQIPVLRNWMVNATEKEIPGSWCAFLIRKRYIDEQLLESVTEKGINSVVNLGAGYDTRLYRFPALQNTSIWELDQAVNIEAKRKQLERVLGAIPAHVKLLSINFVEQTIGDVLSENAYSNDDKTFFIWEAVSQYLSEAAVRKTFDFFSTAASGSRLVFTYVLKDFLEGEKFYGQEKAYKEYVVKSQMWNFGFDPAHLADFLNEYGWRLIEDISYDELSKRYVNPERLANVPMEIERMAFAEKL